MKVNLQVALSDAHLDANQASSQRQLSLSLSAIAGSLDFSLPLNLCLVLDQSGSMNGRPLSTVKEAAIALVESLKPTDLISVVAFNHKAQTLISNQSVSNAQKNYFDYPKTGSIGGNGH